MNDDSRYGLDKKIRLLGPLKLDSGAEFAPIEFAYETYGALNADKSNAVLICHALTGDQYVASTHPISGKDGWWVNLIGMGKPIDPENDFIICINVMGSCLGSSGPAALNPSTDAPYGMDFPVITIADMVRAQAILLDHLGIETLAAVVGGSMGGMQALSWVAQFPQRVESCVVIASAARQSAQNIAFHEVGRQSIMADPRWNKGAYYDADNPPTSGLAVARMAAHITYLSEEGLTQKFRHQGISFVDRFDANSYLYITRAMDYFDLADEYGGTLADAFKGTKTRFCCISFDSDWLYPTSESRRIVHAINAAGVSFVELKSAFGHDSFLLPAPEMNHIISGFLKAGDRR